MDTKSLMGSFIITMQYLQPSTSKVSDCYMNLM